MDFVLSRLIYNEILGRGLVEFKFVENGNKVFSENEARQREEIEIMSLGKNSGDGSVLVLGREDSEVSRN